MTNNAKYYYSIPEMSTPSFSGLKTVLAADGQGFNVMIQDKTQVFECVSKYNL